MVTVLDQYLASPDQDWPRQHVEIHINAYCCARLVDDRAARKDGCDKERYKQGPHTHHIDHNESLPSHSRTTLRPRCPITWHHGNVVPVL